MTGKLLLRVFERRAARVVARWAMVALTASLALHAQPSHAQDRALDELDLVKLLNVSVSTATKTAESVEDAPAVITVVTYDDIVRWGYQSVG